MAYLRIFELASIDNLFDFVTDNGEPCETGYVFINAITRYLGGNYTVFLLWTNFFILYAYYSFSVSMSKYPILVFTSIMLSVNFFPVRQDLAVAITYYAFAAFLEGKKRKTLIIILIAYTIHHASICALAFFLMDKKELSYSKVITYIVLSVALSYGITALVTMLLPLLSIILPHELFAKISVYLATGECVDEDLPQKGIISYTLIVIFIFCGMLFYHKNKNKWNSEERRKWMIILNLMVLSYLVQFAMYGPLYYLVRLVLFYVAANNILIVHSFMYIFSKNNIKMGLRISPYVVLFLLFLFRFYRMTQVFPKAHFPYHLVFNS
jgi:hypothetical protein